jgi:hypothetical protein
LALFSETSRLAFQHRKVSFNRSQKNLLFGSSVPGLANIELDSTKARIFIHLAAVIKVPAQADRGVHALRVQKPAFCRVFRFCLVLVTGQCPGWHAIPMSRQRCRYPRDWQAMICAQIEGQGYWTALPATSLQE